MRPNAAARPVALVIDDRHADEKVLAAAAVETLARKGHRAVESAGSGRCVGLEAAGPSRAVEHAHAILIEAIDEVEAHVGRVRVLQRANREATDATAFDFLPAGELGNACAENRNLERAPICALVR